MELTHYETLYRYELHHWWYRVRRELVHDILLNYFGNQTHLRLVDIGCGTGALTKELERYGECTGIDFSEKALDFCRSRGVRDVQIGTVEATGFEANTFDVVLCLDVLEHIPNDTKGIAEIKRILKPGGVAIIFVPVFTFLWSVTDELSHHYRRYRLPELTEKFRTEDFVLLRKSYFNTFLFPLIALVRIIVRLLGIPTSSEMETGNGMVNAFLYRIFTLERRLLRHMNFPFGVSGMLVIRKK
jgi:SAM-dependent methyltransferase